MRKLCMLVLIISIFFMSGCKPIKKISDTTTKKVTTIGTTTLPHTNKSASCVATYSKYWSIENGMSYGTVVSIVGCEGILQTDSNSNGIHRQSYYWYGETAEQILAVSFENGLSNGASQYNLDKNVDTSNYTRTTINIEDFGGTPEVKGETVYEPTYDPSTGKYYDVNGNVVDVETDPNFVRTSTVRRSTKAPLKTVYEPTYDPKTGKYYDQNGNVIDVETDPNFVRTTTVKRSTKAPSKTIYEPSWDPVAGKYIDPNTGEYISKDR